MKTLIRVLCAALILSSPSVAGGLSAGQTIERFYRQYLDVKRGSRKVRDPAFSKGLKALIAKNRKACGKKSRGEVCGFAADSDPYLDAQDFDDELTFGNSGFKLSEPNPGEVTVTFNLFPVSNPAEPAPRKITFKMIQEKGRWVVDDIIWDKASARKSIEAEIETLQ